MVVDDGLRSGSDRRAVRRRTGRRVRGIIDASEPLGGRVALRRGLVNAGAETCP